MVAAQERRMTGPDAQRAEGLKPAIISFAPNWQEEEHRTTGNIPSMCSKFIGRWQASSRPDGPRTLQQGASLDSADSPDCAGCGMVCRRPPRSRRTTVHASSRAFAFSSTVTSLSRMSPTRGSSGCSPSFGDTAGAESSRLPVTAAVTGWGLEEGRAESPCILAAQNNRKRFSRVACSSPTRGDAGSSPGAP